MNVDTKNVKSETQHIVVKFINALELPHIHYLEDHLLSNKLADWKAMEEMFPGISFRSIYSEQAQANIKALENRVREKDPSYEGSYLLNYFYLIAPSEIDLNELVREIAKWEVVKSTYIPHELAPLPNNPANQADPDQTYLNSAIEGIGAKDAWPLPGGDGSGMKFIDIETGWELEHENFKLNGVSVFSVADPNTNPGAFVDKEHGCSVLGVVAAPDVAHGNIRGIAFKATGKVVSTIRTSQADPSIPPVADATIIAAGLLAEGDVLLIEQQWEDAGKYWPIEKLSKEFDEIKLATQADIVVIEPAGNGGPGNFNPTSTAPVEGNNLAGVISSDSGAIIVGSATKVTPHKRMTRTVVNRESNYGDRVDCYAWGEGIVTTLGIAPSGESTDTFVFGSTSGASAIIAGAALVIQGVAKANNLGGNSNGTFTPIKLREILGSFDPLTNRPWRRTGNDADPPFGTKSNDPATDLIGVMPDLKKIFSFDVYMRDNVGDRGIVPNPAGWTASSPDIIARNNQVLNPSTEYGENSPNRNNGGLGENIQKDGSNKFIYVRALNRGIIADTNAKISAYWSPVQTLPTPGISGGTTGWINNLIGSTNISVPAENKLAVAEIVWAANNIPSSGHYCFIGVIDGTNDKLVIPQSFSNLDEYKSFVLNNNNICHKNFNIVPINSPGAIAKTGGILNAHDAFKIPEEDEIVLQFFVTGAEFGDVEMRLEIGGDLHEDARIKLETNKDFLRNLVGNEFKMEESEENLMRASLGSLGSLPKINEHFGFTPFTFQRYTETYPRDMGIPASLIIHLPEELRTRDYYDIYIRQLHEDTEVGRITWRLVPHKK